MIRFCVEVDEKAWEKLMWALEHEKPLLPSDNPKVKRWIETLNNPEKLEELANAVNELIRRTYASEENNEK